MKAKYRIDPAKVTRYAKEQGHDSASLARAANLSQPTIWRMMHAGGGNPAWSTVAAVASALNVDPLALCLDTPDEEP